MGCHLKAKIIVPCLFCSFGWNFDLSLFESSKYVSIYIQKILAPSWIYPTGTWLKALQIYWYDREATAMMMCTRFGEGSWAKILLINSLRSFCFVLNGSLPFNYLSYFNSILKKKRKVVNELNILRLRIPLETLKYYNLKLVVSFSINL